MSEYLAMRSVDIGSPLSNMLRSAAAFLPRAIAFIVVLIVGYLVARLLRAAVDKLLERVGFDRLVERGGLKTALARSRYDASGIIAQLVFYAVLLITLRIAFDIWGPNAVSTLITAVIAWLPRLFVAILIVVVAAAIASAVRDVASTALGGLSYGRAVANIAFVFILGIGVIAALNQIGVATTVTTPVLIAVLATVGGILIVGVGGGLVKPMQARWDRWLDRAETESARRSELPKAYAAGQSDAERLMAEKQQPAAEPVAAGQQASSAYRDQPVGQRARPPSAPSAADDDTRAVPPQTGQPPPATR
ncbi:mechanosensitive ion channel family protein [Dactylosporangium darangshiense]